MITAIVLFVLYIILVVVLGAISFSTSASFE